jgi:hypothetical protein
MITRVPSQHSQRRNLDAANKCSRSICHCVAHGHNLAAAVPSVIYPASRAASYILSVSVLPLARFVSHLFRRRRYESSNCCRNSR